MQFFRLLCYTGQMEAKWIEIRLRVPPASVDLVCSILGDLGCTGVTVEERQLDSFVPPDPDEPPPGDYLIKSYFPRPDDPEILRRSLRNRLEEFSHLLPGLGPILPEIVPVATEDWAEGWKQHFGLFRVGPRLVIRPTWESYQPAPGEAVLTLDPGMAFGTGTHATTRLCLELVAELFAGDSPPARVLDVGTGSGILAVAAAALGASRVLACDIDPEACRIAAENAGLNGLENLIEITDRPLETLEGEFEAVLANILAEENARLAPALIARLAPGGTLVLSGILGEKEELVTAAFASFPLAGPDIRRAEEWSCIVYRKKP